MYSPDIISIKSIASSSDYEAGDDLTDPQQIASPEFAMGVVEPNIAPLDSNLMEGPQAIIVDCQEEEKVKPKITLKESVNKILLKIVRRAPQSHTNTVNPKQDPLPPEEVVSQNESTIVYKRTLTSL
jgi:hypothetical protein